MRNTEKEKLMEAVFGKNAKRRTFNANDFVSGNASDLNAILKKQSDQIDEMMKESSFTQEDYEKLKREIEQDFGVSLDEDQTVVPLAKKLLMSNQEAEILASEVKKEFGGQDAFVDALCDALRKPFVLKLNSSGPLFKICLCGHPHTGKKEILDQFLSKMSESGYLNAKKTGEIDLARYNAMELDTLFVQDVYAALNKSDVVVFNNVHLIEPATLSCLQNILNDGKLLLKKRYLSSKGQLQETGSTLTLNAIDTLRFDGKGIVVCGDVPLSKLRDLAGMNLMKCFDDIVETSEFTSESLKNAAEKKLEDLKKKCEQLNLLVEIDETCLIKLVDDYRRETGLKGMDDQVERWLKALLQLKIDQQLEDVASLTLCVNQDEVQVILNQMTSDLLKNENDVSASMEKQVLDELNEIVGLDEIKQYVLSLKDHYRIQKLRAQRKMKTNAVSMHMIFTGNPGTGKTTIARILSRYLKAIGILSSGQLIEVTRADLVGRYVGHTAPQCEKVIESALGGVLFIDEAYSLYRGKDDSFGLEAIDALVKGIEDHRDHLLVILAGYTKEMQEFLTSNSGLKSRFPNVIEFPDYSAEQLLEITKSIARSKQYVLHAECDQMLLEYYEEVQRNHAQVAGNGRLARNLVEAAILKQSGRCLEDESAALDELRAEDFELKEVI